jgi:branched-chain amino acid transport system ATP-binding protein
MLRVENISCRYGSILALRDVTLEVQAREFISLIGANGAGKTTLLRAISGLLTPHDGLISFEGRRIDNTPASEIVRLGIAHCPEERKLWPRLSIEEHLRLGAYSRKDQDAISKDIDRIYAIFPKLRERRTQLAGTLSGGEQQMVAIGRAIMSQPKLLMLDEPSLGLAPMIVDQVMETIAEIHRSGITIIMVEQSVAVALRYSERAYVLENGSVVHHGAASILRTDKAVQRAYLGAVATAVKSVNGSEESVT